MILACSVLAPHQQFRTCRSPPRSRSVSHLSPCSSSPCYGQAMLRIQYSDAPLIVLDPPLSFDKTPDRSAVIIRRRHGLPGRWGLIDLTTEASYFSAGWSCSPFGFLGNVGVIADARDIKARI